MESTEQKSKVCARCGNFSRYYTKGQYRYHETKQGHCKKKQEVVEMQDCCECWQNNYKRLHAGKKCSMKVLSELLMEIAAIRQLLQEVQDSEKDL